jgi:hypothetical protein
MSGNRFEQMAARAGEAFGEFGRYLVAHKKPLLVGTATAVYAGLLLYQPSSEAHPLLAGAHEAASFVHEISDYVEQAGGTETLKTFAELALHGYLTPYLSNEGPRLIASLPRDLILGVKKAMEDSGSAVKKLVASGLDRLHFLRPHDHKVYAVAETLEGGLGGLFVSQAHDDVPAEWLSGDGVVFEVSARQAQPKVAVEQLCALGDLMSPAMAATLAHAQDSLASAIGRGEHISAERLQAFADLQAVTQSVAAIHLDHDGEHDPSHGATAEVPVP